MNDKSVTFYGYFLPEFHITRIVLGNYSMSKKTENDEQLKIFLNKLDKL